MIGELFVKEGLITGQQLNEVLAEQKQQRLYIPLGELCVQKGLFSRSALNQILRKYHKSIRLGDLLINMQIITPEQLQQALEHQTSNKKRLGLILVDMGVINEVALVDALSMQLGIPKIVPSLGLIDKRLVLKFNPEFLHKHQFIPAFREGDELTVIMADPLNQDHITFLGKVLRCKVTPAIAPASEIQKTIKLYYHKLEIGQELEVAEGEKDLVIGGTELVKDTDDNIIEIVNFIISTAITDRATDIHIEPQDRFLRIRFRIDGIMSHKTDLPKHVTAKLISRIKAICGLDIAEKRKHQDGRIQARIMKKEFDLRVSTYAAIWGENIVIRIQHRQGAVVDVNKIGFSPANLSKYMKMLDHPSGIILVTGPTGSGKSTTLYASLQYLNKSNKVIVTVEDPVEYTIDGVVQASLPPKVDICYMDYIRAMMRQDPDVIMIGEVRDQEAAEAVIQASLTGHKVLSTFHTDDTAGALLRLMDMGIETFLISSTLVSVVAQRLLRVLCRYCKEEDKPAMTTLSFFTSLKLGTVDRHKFYQAKGCIHCNHTGYKGMTAIHEVLLVNDRIRDEILKRSTSPVIKSISRAHAGLVTLSEDGFYKALTGVTSLKEVIRVVFRDESDGMAPITIEELIRRSESPTERHLSAAAASQVKNAH